jgi:hypothetical protein
LCRPPLESCTQKRGTGIQICPAAQESVKLEVQDISFARKSGSWFWTEGRKPFLLSSAVYACIDRCLQTASHKKKKKKPNYQIFLVGKVRHRSDYSDEVELEFDID